MCLFNACAREKEGEGRSEGEMILTAEPAAFLVVPRQLKKTLLPLHNCFTVSSLNPSRSGDEEGGG